MLIFFTCFIFFIGVVGLIFQPFKVKEVYWAVGAACLLILFNCVSLKNALDSTIKGFDVYCFLIGMMLLSASAKKEGLFEYLSYKAILLSKGSGKRLFSLIFVMGILVTAFLSNDATAVVLTAAVIVVTKSVKVENPLPYLFICAFVANAASFILPISNPANLVIFGSQLPSLFSWLKLFGIPSIITLISTFLLLRWSQHKFIPVKIDVQKSTICLTFGAKISLYSLIFTCILLICCSLSGISMGLPTLIVGIVSTGIQLLLKKEHPIKILKEVHWAVIPMVAALFVLVSGLYQTGIVSILAHKLQWLTITAPQKAVWATGLITSIGANVMNNLPAGLICQDVVHTSEITNKSVISALLVGIDLGP